MYIHGEKGGGGALTGVSGEYQLSGSVSAYQEQDRRSVALFLLLHLHLSAALNTMKLVLRGDIFQWFYSETTQRLCFSLVVSALWCITRHNFVPSSL